MNTGTKQISDNAGLFLFIFRIDVKHAIINLMHLHIRTKYASEEKW